MEHTFDLIVLHTWHDNLPFNGIYFKNKKQNNNNVYRNMSNQVDRKLMLEFLVSLFLCHTICASP